MRLKDAKLRCYFGSENVGALAYADDLTLLAPVSDSIRKTLMICNEYAAEFNIAFNADKSKMMVFGLRHDTLLQCRPKFWIDIQPNEYVSSCSHSGNILHDTQSGAEFVKFRKKFIGQLN
jgi:hypothetical protein